MARYRRSYRRKPQNVVWQPVQRIETIAVPAGAVGTVYSKAIFDTTPGIVENDLATIDQFDDQHVLERIRGAMSHNGDDRVTQASNQWFPFSVAALKIPKGFSSSDPLNLFSSADIEDLAFRMDAVCNANQTTQATPNWHEVDSKAKRKFEIGDKLAWLVSLIRPRTDTFNVFFTVNLRILWKLRT